jgi:hypothetical protein
LFLSGRYSEVDCEKLLYTLTGWELDGSLLTGGRCSEVAVNTGLTVLFLFNFFAIIQKYYVQFFHSWKVRIGDQIHTEGKGNQTRSQTTVNTLFLDIERVFLHPNYDNITAYFDIAVVFTGNVTFSDFITPICLPGSVAKAL